MKQKKEQDQEVAELGIGDILGAAFTIGVTVIGTAYMLEVVGDVKEDACDATLEHWRTNDCYVCPNSTWNTWNGTGLTCHETANVSNSVAASLSGTEIQNASTEGITALSKIPEKLGTIVTIFMAAVLIGLLVRYLWVRRDM